MVLSLPTILGLGYKLLLLLNLTQYFTLVSYIIKKKQGIKRKEKMLLTKLGTNVFHHWFLRLIFVSGLLMFGGRGEHILELLKDGILFVH